jgi:hypothetical protein
LLILLTLVVSAISFDPTTDIEIKFGGWCDHFLTIDECADPATLTAALAQPNLKHMEDDSRILNDPDKKLSIYSLKVNSGYQNFANRQGSRPFSIFDQNGDTMPAGCLLREEDSWSSTSSTYWGIHWGTMYSPLELAQYNARKAYVESEESDTDNKRIYYAYACHYQKPCICRKSGGLSAPDRSLPGTYYSKYGSGGGGTPGPAGPPGPQGPPGPVGSDTTLGSIASLDESILWIVGGIAIVAAILGAIALIMKGPAGPVGTDVEKKPLLTQVRVERQLNKIDF